MSSSPLDGNSQPPIADEVLSLTGTVLMFAIALAADQSGLPLFKRDLWKRIKAEKTMIVGRIFGNRAGGKCEAAQLFEATLRRGLEILQETPPLL